MKKIVNIRIEENDIVLFKTITGELLTKSDLYRDMILFNEQYQILADGVFKDIKFDAQGTKIKEPPLIQLQEIDVL